jgi:hypothetical protein
MGWDKENYVPSVHKTRDPKNRIDQDRIGLDHERELLCKKTFKDTKPWEYVYGPKLYWTAYYWEDVTCKMCLKRITL